MGEAHDASSALDAVDRLAQDGVLLDIHLGEDCGLALARAGVERVFEVTGANGRLPFSRS